MNYLARLKQLKGAENFTHSPNTELPKLTKGGFGGFVSTVQGAYVNISAANSSKVSRCETALDADPTIAYRAWLIYFTDRPPMESYRTPPITHSEILADVPEAIAAEPIAEPTLNGVLPMTAKDEQSIRAWLEHIGDANLTNIAEVVGKCKQDQTARVFFTERARAEMPKHDSFPDHRRTCSQCRNLNGRICTIASPGGVVSANKGYSPNRNSLIRCAGFAPIGAEHDC